MSNIYNAPIIGHQAHYKSNGAIEVSLSVPPLSTQSLLNCRYSEAKVLKIANFLKIQDMPTIFINAHRNIQSMQRGKNILKIMSLVFFLFAVLFLNISFLLSFMFSFSWFNPIVLSILVLSGVFLFFSILSFFLYIPKEKKYRVLSELKVKGSQDIAQLMLRLEVGSAQDRKIILQKLTESKEKISKKEEEYKELASKKEKLEQENKELQQENKELQQEKKDLQQENKELQQEKEGKELNVEASGSIILSIGGQAGSCLIFKARESNSDP